MGLIYEPDNRLETTLVHGASEFELGIIGRLNAMISAPNSGRGRRFRGGDPGSLGTRFGGWLKSPQNFANNAVVQSAGSTRGMKTDQNKGLPDSQPPAGTPTPLADLLLQRPIR